MSKLRNRSRLLIGASLAFVAVSFTPFGRAAAETMKPLLVKIVNDAALPVLVRDVDHAARQTFVASIACAAGPGATGCSEALAIPEGKLLIIETISAQVEVPTGQQPRSACGVGQVLFDTFQLPLQKVASEASEDEYAAIADVRLYAAAGQEVRFFLFRGSLSGVGAGTLSLAGHLVDCAPGPGCALPF